MKHYSEAAVERMMKVQEVILRAMTGKLRGWQAADILGVTERQDILAEADAEGIGTPLETSD